MGMWDYKPWDNDSAADWFGDFMDKTEFRKHWLDGMNSDLSEEPDELRAAISLFIMLGRVYVWPIEQFDDDLELAIVKSECLLDVPEYEESPELIELIKIEINELRSRRTPKKENDLTPSKNENQKKWWEFWK
ncbi:MAG: hypothetical protein COA78_36245 [Blastopirellula sp.]|nr:MAG: hypothetical protein COA78_36245 [Blastopirellula sp.]